MSEYEPLRIHVYKFVGKREALEKLFGTLMIALKGTRTNRFQFKCSIVELEPLKPRQEILA